MKDLQPLVNVNSYKVRRNVPTKANERHRFNSLYLMEPYV